MKLAHRLMMGGFGRWTPADVATELWLDAADASTITESAGLVTQWADKSGNDRHALQDTYPPALIADALNGLPIIRGDGDDHMVLPAMDIGAHTIFLVCKLNTLDAAYNSAFCFKFNTTANYFTILSVGTYGGTGYKAGVASASAATLARLNQTIDTAGYHTLTIKQPNALGASSQFRLDGETKTMTTSTAQFSSNAANTGRIFSYSDGLAPAKLDMAELIVAPGITSESLTLKMENYLATKWGL